MDLSLLKERITCSAIRVILDPGLQHDPSEAVPRHVHVGCVQPLLLRLAHTVVDGSRNLDGVGEISQPAGGDSGPEANSGQLFLNLCNQWPVLLARNLRSSLNQGVPGRNAGSTCAPGIIMKPRSEPVEVSSGALIVQEAACKSSWIRKSYVKQCRPFPTRSCKFF